jgi:hypothetical protein
VNSFLHFSRTQAPAVSRIKWCRISLWLILVVTVAIGIFYVHRYYASTPYRTLRLFVNALNAGDFDAQYALFVKNESGGMPLLPKEEFKSLLGRMEPPFPKGIKISMREVAPEHYFENEIDGFTVWILSRGEGVVATGKWPDYFDLPIQRTNQGWGVRPFYMYHSYYRRTYGEQVASRFQTLYVQAAYRLGLWNPLKSQQQ